MRLRLTIHRCRAGAVHTPHVRLTLSGSDEGDHRRPAQILMLSGIGPADHLKKLDVPVLVDLPGVGSHLMDHVVIDMNILDKSQQSISHIRADTFLRKLQLLRTIISYNTYGGGPLTSNVSISPYRILQHL